MIKLTLTTALIASVVAGVAQTDRGVYMIHGYPGGTGSLDVGADFLLENGPNAAGVAQWEELTDVHITPYDNGRGVERDADDVGGDLRFRIASGGANGAVGARSIAFGSSYGGLVARQIAFDEINRFGRPISFGGIITHGTPNAGATIAANIDEVAAWGGNMAEDIATPFIMEGASSIPILGDIPAFRGVARLTEGPLRRLATLTPGTSRFTAGLIGSVVDIGIGFGGSRNSAQDMVPGSRVVNTLEAAPLPGIERQLTFAVEDEDDLLYRLLSGPIQASARIVGPFGGNADVALQPLIGFEALLATRRELWATRAADMNWSSLQFIDGALRTRRRVREIGNAYGDAARRMTTADATYKRLAGFTVTRATGEREGGACFCVDEGGGREGNSGVQFTRLFGVDTRAECMDFITRDCFDTVWRPGREQTAEVYLPNDGIVTVESQQAFTEDFRVEMPGDNHFSSNNSRNYEDALEEIFDGDSNPWFESE